MSRTEAWGFSLLEFIAFAFLVVIPAGELLLLLSLPVFLPGSIVPRVGVL